VKLPLDILPEVRRAFAANRPVVALESTLITHGMPWPGNLETARAASDAVRGVGGVPATVLVEGGFTTRSAPVSCRCASRV
jgi:pseudouridine-5'-phosphate glycosidase